MEEMLENFKSLWIKSLEDKKLSGATPPGANGDRKFVTMHRVRLLEDSIADLEAFLWKEFKSCHDNLYYLHLRLAEYCLTTWFKDLAHKEACVLFLNRTFENWIRTYAKQHNDPKAQETTGENRFALEPYHILKAFDLASKNVTLLTSFNKIYKFEQNFAMLRVKMDELAQKMAGPDLIKIVTELKVNDLYPIDYEPIIVPLMISDKYKIIDELVSNNEKTLFAVVAVCDKICAENINFKKIAENYDCKKSNRFSGSQVAKFALGCLKKVKKSHLIYSTYTGIQFQLRLNQLRFLINSAYNSTDPMSFYAWSELVMDLVGNDEKLIYQLFFEIIHFNQDINLGAYLADKYGPEYIRKLPAQTQDFFNQNWSILKNKYMDNIVLKWAPPIGTDYFFPEELTEDNIEFVDNPERFGKMLDFFEQKKPDVIGLDCEWKPMFGPDDTDLTNESKAAALNAYGDKNQRANLLQIATRERTFVVEVRDLVDILDQASLDRFGQLVLFASELVKLGYNFEQDSHRLAHCFWKFQHKLCEFTQSVVNMDEVASDVQRRFKLFVEETPATAVAATTATKQGASSQKGGNGGGGGGNGGLKPKGLSKLTQVCFGKPLDKRECMSNWQNRPLRREQLRYAALDAYILIKIHDLFVEKFKSLNMEFDYVSNARKNLL